MYCVVENPSEKSRSVANILRLFRYSVSFIGRGWSKHSKRFPNRFSVGIFFYRMSDETCRPRPPIQ